MDCGSNKISNYGLNHELFLSLFNFLGVCRFKFKNSGLKSWFLYYLRFKILLDVQANLPETSPLVIYPNGCAEQIPLHLYGAWDV